MENSVLRQPPPPGTGDGDMAFSLNGKTVSGMRTENAKNVTYDDSMKSKDINWITDNMDIKISPYKPDEVLLSNMKVASAAAEAAFTAIFAPKCLVQPILSRTDCKEGCQVVWFFDKQQFTLHLLLLWKATFNNNKRTKQ